MLLFSMAEEHLRVTLPIEGATSAFVQLSIDDELFLRSGRFRNAGHAEVLEAALEEFNLPHAMIKMYDGREILAVRGERYVVAGMGLITNLDSVVDLRGESAEYGLGISARHFDEIKGCFSVPATRE